MGHFATAEQMDELDAREKFDREQRLAKLHECHACGNVKRGYNCYHHTTGYVYCNKQCAFSGKVFRDNKT